MVQVHSIVERAANIAAHAAAAAVEHATEVSKGKYIFLKEPPLPILLVNYDCFLTLIEKMIFYEIHQ